MRDPVDVRHSLSFVLTVVHVDVAHHGVGDQLALAGFQRIFHGGERAAEVGKRHAAPLAGSAVVACRAPVVILRQNRCAANGYSAPEFILHAIAQLELAASHFHGR